MRNILYKGFVIEPSIELVPRITISPFSLNSENVKCNYTIERGGGCLKC